MKVGIVVENEEIYPHYQSWGLEGSIRTRKLTEGMIRETESAIKSIIDLSEYRLYSSVSCEQYQGSDQQALNIAWLRYVKNENNLLGEHISILYDLNNERIIGFTRLLKKYVDPITINPHRAFNIAVQFLQKNATDLMINAPEVIELPEIEENTKIEFNPALNLGQHVEWHWIGEHTEKMTLNGKEYPVRGMKVKLYLPKLKLWAWVIVANDGSILTFERNIDWDFVKFQRNTQMWLHDHWLLANGLLK